MKKHDVSTIHFFDINNFLVEKTQIQHFTKTNKSTSVYEVNTVCSNRVQEFACVYTSKEHQESVFKKKSDFINSAGTQGLDRSWMDR